MMMMRRRRRRPQRWRWPWWCVGGCCCYRTYIDLPSFEISLCFEEGQAGPGRDWLPPQEAQGPTVRARMKSHGNPKIPSVLNGWPADPNRSSMNGGFCGKIIYKRGDCHGLSIAMLDCRRVARKDRKASWLMVDAGWFLMGGSVWEVMLILITTSNKLKILKLRDQDTTGAGKLQTVCPGVFVWRFLCEARWTPSHPRSPSLFHTLSLSLSISPS